MPSIKTRRNRVVAPKTREEFARITNAIQGDLIYVSGSSGIYLAGYDGVTTGPILRLPKYNVSAAAPTTSDDRNRGYALFSQWINTAAEDIYSCVDVTSAAAVWVKLNA